KRRGDWSDCIFCSYKGKVASSWIEQGRHNFFHASVGGCVLVHLGMEVCGGTCSFDLRPRNGTYLSTAPLRHQIDDSNVYSGIGSGDSIKVPTSESTRRSSRRSCGPNVGTGCLRRDLRDPSFDALADFCSSRSVCGLGEFVQFVASVAA